MGGETNLIEQRSETEKKVVLMLPASSEVAIHPRWRTESTRIRGAIGRASNSSEKIELQDRPFIHSDELPEELTKLQPYIVHITGIANGIEKLILGNSYQKNQDELINELFELYSGVVHCVILSGCHSEQQVREIVQHIEFVITISSDLEETHAVNFLNEFYYQLASEPEIARSYKLGCHLLKKQENFDSSNLPKLLIKSEEIKHRELEKELKSYTELIEEDQNNVNLWENKARLLIELGHIKEAEEAFERASLLAPKNHSLRVQQGDALQKIGENQKAIEAYDKALDSGLGERDYKVWWKKARILAKTKNYLEAAESYKSTLSLIPSPPDDYVICIEYAAILDKLKYPLESVLLSNTSLCLEPKYRIAKYEKRRFYKSMYVKQQ